MLHELTTNAVKYGAWSQGGTIAVHWKREGDDVRMIWREHGVTLEQEPERRGFGSMLMISAARQFGGSLERDFHRDGLEVVIVFPFEE